MSEPLDLEAIKRRAEAATPGPWEWDTEDGECLRSLTVRDREYGEFGSLLASYPRAVVMGYPCQPGTGFAEYGGADAEFIAHARSDVPALVAEVERLRETVGLHHAAMAALGASDKYEACPVCIPKS